jgi:hypothetical protein
MRFGEALKGVWYDPSDMTLKIAVGQESEQEVVAASQMAGMVAKTFEGNPDPSWTLLASPQETIHEDRTETANNVVTVGGCGRAVETRLASRDRRLEL